MASPWLMSGASGAEEEGPTKPSPFRLVGWEAQHSQPTTLPRRCGERLIGASMSNGNKGEYIISAAAGARR